MEIKKLCLTFIILILLPLHAWAEGLCIQVVECSDGEIAFQEAVFVETCEEEFEAIGAEVCPVDGMTAVAVACECQGQD